MSDVELRDELVTVLGAGHETTATGLAWAVERLVRNPEVLREAARLARRRRGGLPERDREGDAAGAAGDRRRRPQADRAGDGRRLRAAGRDLRPAGDRRPPLPRGHLPRAATASGPSASSTPRPTTTPGSRSAAASAAASAPPSPNTRCGRSCASSSPAPSCAPAEAEGRGGAGPQHHPGAGQGHAGRDDAARLGLERRARLASAATCGLGLLPLRVELFDRRFALAWRSPARSARPGLAQAAGSASSSSISRSSASARSICCSSLAARCAPPSAPAWSRCTSASPPPLADRRPRRRGRRGALVLAPLVLGPAARRGWRRLAVVADERAAADRLEQGPVVGDQQDRALELGQRVLERLAALDVEVVGRLVEDQDVGAGGDEDRQREPPLLAAGDVGELLFDVLAGEEEAAEQGARLRPGEAGLALGGVEHGALAGRRLGVLGEVAELDVVAAADAAGGRLADARRGSRSGSSCRCRWRRRGRRARRARVPARRPRAAPGPAPRSGL